MVDEMIREHAAHQILQVLPALKRILSTEVRRTENAMDPAHYGLLVRLSRCPHSLGELAERQGVSLATMSNSVSALAERGWVTRVPSRDDRRVMIVELTPRGAQVLSDVQLHIRQCLMDLLANLSPEQLDQVVAGVEILEGILPSSQPEGASRFSGAVREDGPQERH